MKQATTQWLCEHHFPRAEQVCFCLSLMNKFLRVYQHLREMPERFLLIDDLAPQLSEAFLQLRAGNHPKLTGQECQHVADLLQRHLILVAFGTSCPSLLPSELQIVALRSWEELESLRPSMFSQEKGILL